MNSRVLMIVAVVLVIGIAIYYQQHTHTASVELGGKSLSVTTHD